jgi:hypothetical protein
VTILLDGVECRGFRFAGRTTRTEVPCLFVVAEAIQRLGRLHGFLDQ